MWRHVFGPLLQGLLGVAHKYLATWIGEQVMYDLRLQLFAHVQRQSLAFFANAKPGEVISRVLTDVQGVGQALQDNLVKLLQNILTLTVSTVLLVVLDWRLALVALSALPLFVFPAKRVGRQRKELKKQTQARMAELTGILMETLSVSGVLLIKVFGARKRETRRLREKAQELQSASLHQTLVGRWFQLLMKLFEDLGPALVYGVGGYLVIRGELGLGTVLAFVVLLRKLYSPASDLAGVHVDIVTSYGYFERVLAVLDLEPAIKNAPGAISLADVKGALKFENVSFSYGSEAETLSNIELEIAPGESLAVVGPSGAGKTTLAALTLRLYDPSAGRILLDGHDYREIKLKTLRQHIAVVSQETYLFHASIADKPALRAARGDQRGTGAGGARRADSRADRQAAARLRHPGRGARASLVGRRTPADRHRAGHLGQSQNPDLGRSHQRCGFHERAADPGRAATALGRRTCLIIAHRLSTIQKADRIVSLDQGRIVEVGDHRSLLERGGLYARLFDQQTATSANATASSPPG